MALFCSNLQDCLCTQMVKISSGYETMSENWLCLSTFFNVDHYIHVEVQLRKNAKNARPIG